MVKQGYKQTEIGVIPEEWSCAKIEDIATISMCKRIFADQTTENGEVPFYKIGTFGKEADAYISVALYNEYRNKFSFPQKGDVLISAAGTLGRTVVYDGKDAYFQDSNIVWLDIDKNVLCNEYLNHYYRVVKWASSEGSTIARLYNGIIYATNIALPPIEEQKRIAEALSDVDSMISSLEKLIAKKKAVKQGAMQELLTGKKRLPGFTGEWTVKYIDDIATIMDNCRIPVKESDREKMAGTIPYCGANGIVGYINGYTIDDEIILIAEDGGYFDEYATRPIAYKMSGKCWVNNHAHILKSKSNTDQNYLFYCLVHKDIRDFISSGTRSKLNKAELLKITIKLPLCLEEQIAIASILSDMDSEIEALEQKLKKTRQVKQGMMQQLLTGKIRLV